MEYLHKLSTLVDSIANNSQKEFDKVIDMNNDLYNKCKSDIAKKYIDRMSRRLLMEVFHPCSFTSLLPCHSDKNNDNFMKVLRAMAPLSMDICASIVCILFSSVSHTNQNNSTDINDNNFLIPYEYTLRAFILFSTWLPIAPQLSSLVSDLFHRREFTNPLYYLNSDTNNIKEVPQEWKHIIARASHYLIKFYVEKGEKKYLKDWWDWSPLFGLLNYQEDYTYNKNISLELLDSKNENKMNSKNINSVTNIKCLVSKPKQQYYQHLLAAKWHAARAVSFILPLSSHSRYQYLKKIHMQEEIVPWVIHPHKVLDDDVSYQDLMVKSQSILFFNNEQVIVPTSEEIRKLLLLPCILVHVGYGLVFYRNGGVDSIFMKDICMSISNTNNNRLIYTNTTMHNLMLLGLALSSSEVHPRPILVIGPVSCGKSTLIRELSKLTNNKLVELHIDDETDSKTLLGSYTATDIVGEFVWKPGILTIAARDGLWILLENLDTCPLDVQAAVVKLLEERILPLGGDGMGGRMDERCHPNFRLWATCCSNQNQIKIANKDANASHKRVSSTRVKTKSILHPGLWRKVLVNPLPYDELKELGMKLHLNIGEILLEKILELFCRLDHFVNKGKKDVELKERPQSHPNTPNQTKDHNYPCHESKHIFIRNYIKLLNRISHSISLEPNASYITESQRMLCLLETFDVLALSMSCPQQRRDLVLVIAAPTWDVHGDTAIHYIESRRPEIECSNKFIKIGRCHIHNQNSGSKMESSLTSNIKNDKTIRTYVDTNFSLRLMESVAVCVSRNEPLLLVGETGCGKTALLQRMSDLLHQKLIVLNLSLQTDSTDLLGGYQPLEMKHLARRIYSRFLEMFISTFSRSQNKAFLDYVCTAFEKGQWKRFGRCLVAAGKMGLEKLTKDKQRKQTLLDKSNVKTTIQVNSCRPTTELWLDFFQRAEQFERQRIANETGFAFAFVEGALVDAIRCGKWVLLDEINLASSETLQRLTGLLDDTSGSLILAEKGDSKYISRHPEFRLFAAMNPATDIGKKDLPIGLLSRFTEIYIDDLLDPMELGTVASRYLHEEPHSQLVRKSVDAYLHCRHLSINNLADASSGQRPQYTLRTFCRALLAANYLRLEQNLNSDRSIWEGFQLAFEGCLDDISRNLLNEVLLKYLIGEGEEKWKGDKESLEIPGRLPVKHKGNQNDYILVKPFWLPAGPLAYVNSSESPHDNFKETTEFVLTPSMSYNLRRLARAVVCGQWPILLEGPTSSGKTSLISYLASITGHRCIRINNHEHTDVQEYIGSYVADSNGRLSFQPGILVQSLQMGYWVVLDELNLAPSDVLEALNRLLDDNRELYVSEINEYVRPHDHFRLFATQNPSGSLYGGRKPLSRAFRNRFVEIHMPDIPECELSTILHIRCSFAPSHAKLLVKVLSVLRNRRNKKLIFCGKDGLVTPRDLFCWADRARSTKKIDLAREGCMLLVERLRDDEEKETVRSIITDIFKVKSSDLDWNWTHMYMNNGSEYSMKAKKKFLEMRSNTIETLSMSGLYIPAIAPTNSFMRVLTLVERCIQQKEPVLLIGETGCGKTTVIQLLSVLFSQTLNIVNLHQNTESSDLLGCLHPFRGRIDVLQKMIYLAKKLWKNYCYNGFNYLGNILAPPCFLECDSDDLIELHYLPDDAAESIVLFTKRLRKYYHRHNNDNLQRNNHLETNREATSSQKHAEYTLHRHQHESDKRRKLVETTTDDVFGAKIITNQQDNNHSLLSEFDNKGFISMESCVNTVELLYQRYTSLFEWIDGPLVRAMKRGEYLLLDELSLADDAVLERLNSVLEPSRSLVLAEKVNTRFLLDEADHDHNAINCISDKSRFIEAHSDFRIFATMNPGGDYGKRELSPALRSRFTEIWVPSIIERDDIAMVLERVFTININDVKVCNTLKTDSNTIAYIRKCMLDYVDWFNHIICQAETNVSSLSDFALSLRDILSWAHFMVKFCSKSEEKEYSLDTNIWLAYVHGASLMHLDGLGLGMGLSRDESSSIRTLAKNFITNQIPSHDIHKKCIVGFYDELDCVNNVLITNDKEFGAHPFYIPVGPETIPNDLNFQLGVPTTDLNLRRILRALQISKPILLEGSPGVGKTSLVSTLATASGHKLVRINLSEQTDISDLMGSDLPLPTEEKRSESSPNCHVSKTNRCTFKWHDGVLLKAIKSGSWVLLDELNLASQTVLEGLNSCLDHRSNVYIPELGQTFECPSTFQIFASQNPLVQGGGRKGLPKSFLNRFTKVYMNPLSSKDLQGILTARYHTFPAILIENMVKFNGTIQQDVIIAHEYGQSGSPWEFNLRDLFRWCDLVNRDVDSKLSDDNVYEHCVGLFVDTIYFQRFRSQKDREMVVRRYEECFGLKNCNFNKYPLFNITETHVVIGNALLNRKIGLRCYLSHDDSLLARTEPCFLRHLLYPMEAVAHCIYRNWPCLLVGQPASGKSTLINILAETCNVDLEIFNLTSSSDVNELVGSFEQIDAFELHTKLLQSLQCIHDLACISLTDYHTDTISLQDLSRLHRHLIDRAVHSCQKEFTLSFKGNYSTEFLDLADEFLGEIENILCSCVSLDQLCGPLISSARGDWKKLREEQTSKSNTNSGSLHFRWVDGILVKAMKNGSWLLLENVNLCSSSVLDRLNPVMEFDGELIITECGSFDEKIAFDESGLSRAVKPHPDFRLFLSMCPSHGEVSRAMRNRCVEVCILLPTEYHTEKLCNKLESNRKTNLSCMERLDILESMWQCGVRSTVLAERIMVFHKEFIIESTFRVEIAQLYRCLREYVVFIINALRCGFFCEKSLQLAYELAYEHSCEYLGLSHVPYPVDEKVTHGFSCLVEGMSISKMFAFNPIWSRVGYEARLMKVMVTGAAQIPLGIAYISDDGMVSSRYCSHFNEFWSPVSLCDKRFMVIKLNIIACFVRRMTLKDYRFRALFFDGFCTETSDSIKFLTFKCYQILERVGLLKMLNNSVADNVGFCTYYSRNILNLPDIQRLFKGNINTITDSIHFINITHFSRLAQILEEYKLKKRVRNLGSNIRNSSHLSVIELSYCIHEGLIDNMSVLCPVIPLLYLLIQAMDNAYECSESIFSSIDITINTTDYLFNISKFISCRDRLWRCLKELYVNKKSFLGFEEDGFLVQWTWVKKGIHIFFKNMLFVNVFSSELNSLSTKIEETKQKLYSFIRNIDKIIFDKNGNLSSLSNSAWKNGGHPLVPSFAEDWKVLHALINTSKQNALLSEDRFEVTCAFLGSYTEINMSVLLYIQHPSLFIETNIKEENLIAICMVYWATTDELCLLPRECPKNFNVNKALSLLKRKCEVSRQTFIKMLHTPFFDNQINTIDNEMNIENFDRVQLSPISKSDSLCNKSVEQIYEVMLEKFGSIQTTQIYEFWCVNEERWIVENLSMIAILKSNNKMMNLLLKYVVPRLKKFISIVISHTVWPVIDLRPYQTIVWVCECSPFSFDSFSRLLDCFLCTLIITFTQHCWCNNFNDLSLISEDLSSPSFWSQPLVESTVTKLNNSNEELVTHPNITHRGIPRLQHNVISTTIFRLLGPLNRTYLPCFRRGKINLENYYVRKKQSRELISFLSSNLHTWDKIPSLFYMIRYLVFNVFHALRDSFDTENTVYDLYTMFIDHSFYDETTFLDRELLKCTNDTFLALIPKVVKPLYYSLRDKCLHTSDENLFLSLIYVGLLRFHIFAPSSPMDPSRKPGAKVSQWDDYLFNMNSRLFVNSIESGLERGNLVPDSSENFFLLEEVKHATVKRRKQDKKRVERPSNTIPFYQLFREVQHFGKTFCSVDNVLGLLQCIITTRKSKNTSFAWEKELHWQRSTSAFCYRVTTEFSAYEDVTTPFVAAVRTIQEGVRGYTKSLIGENSHIEDSILSLQDDLLQFPFQNILMPFDAGILHQISCCFITNGKLCPDKISLIERTSRRCQLSFLFYILSRIHLQVSIQGTLEINLIQNACSIFAKIATVWLGQDGEVPNEYNDIESEENQEEIDFRKKFPDHTRDFHKITEAVEILKDDRVPEEAEFLSNSSIQHFALSNEYFSFICDLHAKLFTRTCNSTNDLYRIRTFQFAYETAFELNSFTEYIDQHQPEHKRFGAHALALALNTSSKYGFILNGLKKPSYGSPDFDFHSDPFPEQVILACKPLRLLLSRFSQLLHAFPDNSILLEVSHVAERLYHMDLKNVSLGKFLTGFELILQKSQEWEQHVNSRVAIGDPLKEISHLVVKWRKLELDCWNNLLNVCDRHHVSLAQSHWARLYSILHLNFIDTQNCEKVNDMTGNRLKSNTIFEEFWNGPSWILVGLDGFFVKDDSDHIISGFDEVIQVLDSFMSTSNFGQFSERLQLIASFSNQLTCQCKISNSKVKNSLAVSLRSMWEYYCQFEPLITNTKVELRKPIEKRLRDEVKLAKWDKQSFYALAESSEKNHRKLMKFIKEYEQVLETNIVNTLEEDYAHGIRPKSEIENDFGRQYLTEISHNSTMFPQLEKTEKICSQFLRQTISTTPLIEKLIVKNRKWTVVNKESPYYGKFISCMIKFSIKMEEMFNLNDSSIAGLGAYISNIVSSSIFDRIDSLREKGTKMMKKRALIDLFKLLQVQGFSSMRYSVPQKIRKMTYLMELSTPRNDGLSFEDKQLLETSESYFKRCIIELSSLRYEIEIIGSKYMSQREMYLMMGFSEHGFLMVCQQRCMLADVIENMVTMYDLIRSYNNLDTRLHHDQISLRDSVKKIDLSFISIKESFKQLLLFLKITTQSGEEKKKKLINDIIHKLEYFSCLLSKIYKPFSSEYFISNEKLNSIKLLQAFLQDIYNTLSLITTEFEVMEDLTFEVMNNCLRQIELTCSYTSLYNEKLLINFNEGHEKNDIPILVSSLIECTLLAAQSINTGTISKVNNLVRNDGMIDEDNFYYRNGNAVEGTIWESHRQNMKEWKGIHVGKMKRILTELTGKLQMLHNVEDLTSYRYSFLLHISEDACSLAIKVLDVMKKALIDFLSFYRNTVKLEYILLRLFRTLISKGFCSDNVDQGECDTSNTKLQDNVQGIGMGEGEGREDVSEQILNQEQLMDMKQDRDQTDQLDSLNNEIEINKEDDKGIETEKDFQSNIYNFQENDFDENKLNEEEELDREMGNENDLNERVIDEKMWNSDGEDDLDEQQNKENYEKDSKVSGKDNKDYVRTKDDDEREVGQTKNDIETIRDNMYDKNTQSYSDDDIDNMVNNCSEKVYEEGFTDSEVQNDDNRKESYSEMEEDCMSVSDNFSINDRNKNSESNKHSFNLYDLTDDEDQTHSTNCPIDEQENVINEMNETYKIKLCNEGTQGSGELDQKELYDDKESNLNQSSKIQKKTINIDDKVLEDENDFNNSTDSVTGDKQSAYNNNITVPSENMANTPNPFSDPEDAEKFWHKKLNIIEDTDSVLEDPHGSDSEEKENNNDQINGNYEYVSMNKENTTHVLGNINDEETSQIKDIRDLSEMDKSDIKKVNAEELKEDTVSSKKKKKEHTEISTDTISINLKLIDNTLNKVDDVESDIDSIVSSSRSIHFENVVKDIKISSKEVLNQSQISVQESEIDAEYATDGKLIEVYDRSSTAMTYEEEYKAQLMWSKLQSETNFLSRRLCEKLRLVMEPLLATKLSGDYRTGKRINMKRVINYIASGYRKDKIWLRRKKPVKRSYRVLLAVDNSESMDKTGVGKLALTAMTILANGMSQLEIGELGIASFGEEMHLLHPFNKPFTYESGLSAVSNFRFNDRRTKTALCVESALVAMDSQNQGFHSSKKIFFIISDGRIERDSKVKLRQLVREMWEKNILLLMIIVEGKNKSHNKKESIITMKEITFENGIPRVKLFIEDYPFPYYIILDDINTLPEILGDALKQWFEMLLQCQKT